MSDTADYFQISGRKMADRLGGHPEPDARTPHPGPLPSSEEGRVGQSASRSHSGSAGFHSETA